MSLLRRKKFGILAVMGVAGLLAWVISAALNTSKIELSCLSPPPDAGSTFGADIAVSSKFIAVAEPKQDRVAIYHKNEQGEWVFSHIVRPPVDEGADCCEGNKFGAAIAIADDKLFISRTFAYIDGQSYEYTRAMARNKIEDQRTQFLSAIYVANLGEGDKNAVPIFTNEKRHLITVANTLAATENALYFPIHTLDRNLYIQSYGVMVFTFPDFRDPCLPVRPLYQGLLARYLHATKYLSRKIIRRGCV